MKKNVTERVFQCPVCQTKHTAYKRSSKRTTSGHIKTMYCWKCQTIRDLVQLPKYE